MINGLWRVLLLGEPRSFRGATVLGLTRKYAYYNIADTSIYSILNCNHAGHNHAGLPQPVPGCTRFRCNLLDALLQGGCNGICNGSPVPSINCNGDRCLYWPVFLQQEQNNAPAFAQPPPAPAQLINNPPNAQQQAQLALLLPHVPLPDLNVPNHATQNPPALVPVAPPVGGGTDYRYKNCSDVHEIGIYSNQQQAGWLTANHDLWFEYPHNGITINERLRLMRSHTVNGRRVLDFNRCTQNGPLAGTYFGQYTCMGNLTKAILRNCYGITLVGTAHYNLYHVYHNGNYQRNLHDFRTEVCHREGWAR